MSAAESGSTVTPDGRTYLVNKDIGADRWTIALTTLPGDTARLVNVTGNVFRSDGGPPAFVVCQANVASIGDLADRESVFSFSCRGAGACASDAKDCAANDWQLIADDVRLDAAFFLPATGDVESVSGPAPGSHAVGAVAGRAAPRGRGGRRGASPAQSTDRGETLSFDQFAYLVNSDIGNERWSIALNIAPVATEAGTVTRIESVTGNVFKRDGSAPSFVYCTERPDSQGSLEDDQSTFRLSCSGATACSVPAEQCALAWSVISDDVPIPASYFLPPGGLPALEGSDPSIFVIGRASDPAAIATREYTLLEGAASARGTVAGTCPTGSACAASRIGSCTDVRGTIDDIAGFGCACRVDDLPTSCIACGSGAAGTCGGACEFAVGGATARGECLFASSGSDECACYAVAAGGAQTVTGCSGPLDAVCAAGRCCADDPRDGCSVAGEDVSCAGTCVASDCAPGEPCGICLPELSGSICGDGKRTGLEQCEGDDVPGDCAALGRPGGTLGCDDECRFDLTRCGPSPTGSPIQPPTPTPDPAPSPTGPPPTTTITPSPTTPTPSPTIAPTATPTRTPTPTPATTGTPTPTPEPTPTPQGEDCPYDVDSGDEAGLDVIVNVGVESGTATLTYEPFGEPVGGGNAFTVETLEGSVLFSSGCVFDPDNNFYPPLQDSFSFSGGPFLRLRVDSFCNGGSGGDTWTVNLSCG